MSTGAAPSLTLDLALAAKSRGIRVHVVIKSDNELFERFNSELETQEITIIKFRKSVLFALLNLMLSGKSIFRKFGKKLIPFEPIIFPMPGIFEFKVPTKVQREFKIITFMHDPRKHRGDLLPRNFMVKSLYLKAQFLVYFSNFTKKELESQYGYRNPPNLVMEHPIPSLATRLEETKRKSNDYILLIGRNKRYQNYKSIVDFWLAKNGNFPNMSLVLAGKNVSEFDSQESRILTEDRWLNENEFGELVLGARALVLPYLEASQSGPACLAMALGKNIIYRPVGGLTEQLSGYGKAIPYSNDSELDKAIQFVEIKHDLEKNENIDWERSWFPFLDFCNVVK
jgi:hypothetical protein